MARELHMVCLDVPWPADYGGAIDMMNRLIAFRKIGIGIHLHYFSYNERGRPPELEQYCQSVNVYERRLGKKGIAHALPYFIASRVNEDLLANLSKDSLPILLEGLHSTGILEKIDTTRRKVVVRLHNEESIYYRELARATPSFWKKLHFLRESHLAHRHTAHLPADCVYACLSPDDMAVIKDQYHLANVVFIPIFPSWQTIRGEEGMGNLCLYHGNLSVPENEEAAIWLLRKVFMKVRKPFVIAGKKPSRRLQKLAHLCQHTCLVADPSEAEINDLIRKAHINVLPCFSRRTTGVRLKLLHALFEGRHCIANENMVRGTGLSEACHIGTNADSFASIIMQLSHHPYTHEETLLRQRLLGDTYDNEKNAARFIPYLW